MFGLNKFFKKITTGAGKVQSILAPVEPIAEALIPGAGPFISMLDLVLHILNGPSSGPQALPDQAATIALAQSHDVLTEVVNGLLTNLQPLLTDFTAAVADFKSGNYTDLAVHIQDVEARVIAFQQALNSPAPPAQIAPGPANPAPPSK